MQKRLLKDKRGAEDIIYPEVIFIILNIMFFGIILIWVFGQASGAVVYEQAYAKQIGLLIDEAKPGMEISLDFSKALEIAEKNEYNDGLVFVKEDNVIVKLSKIGGYGFNYYSDYNIQIHIEGDNLIIKVGEEGEEQNV